MKKNKIIGMFFLVFIAFSMFVPVFATDNVKEPIGGDIFDSLTGQEISKVEEEEKKANTQKSQSDDFWNSATDWFKKVNKNKDLDGVDEVVKTFTDMISVVGNTVFVIVTIFLGIKYMYGSVDAKASVKESLVSLLVACVFFFGWDALSNLLFPRNNFIFIQSSDTSYEQMVGRIFAFATYIAQFLAILGIIYVGVRYIFAGAEGKASLKGKSAVFLIGIILTFCATSFLSFVSDIVNDSIKSGSATGKNNVIVQEMVMAKDESILINNKVFSI